MTRNEINADRWNSRFAMSNSSGSRISILEDHARLISGSATQINYVKGGYDVVPVFRCLVEGRTNMDKHIVWC